LLLIGLNVVAALEAPLIRKKPNKEYSLHKIRRKEAGKKRKEKR
jgi:hypothetical protein